MGKFSTVCSSCSSLNCFRLFATPWTVDQASRSFSVSWSLLRFMCIVSVMPSSHPILCHPLLLLPSVFSSIRVFSNELAFRIRWPEYWSLSPSPSSEYSGLISFRVDWFDLLAVQGTLKSLLQHHSSKAMFISVLFTLEVLFWMSDWDGKLGSPCLGSLVLSKSESGERSGRLTSQFLKLDIKASIWELQSPEAAGCLPHPLNLSLILFGLPLDFP